MTSPTTTPCAPSPTPSLGWARRVVRRQLDALSRLAATAWRLVEAATAQAESEPAPYSRAGILVLQRARDVHRKVRWAFRLIDALRLRLLGDLQTVRDGEVPASLLQSLGLDADREPCLASEPEGRAETAERAERPEGVERERGDSFSRLLGKDDFADILKRPTDEIIALICRELGLPDDWPRLAEAAFERAEGLREDRGGGGQSAQGGASERQIHPSTPALSSA